MSDAIEYRQRAEEHRRAAAMTTLPNVRAMLASAAERWDYLAEEIERCERGMLNWPAPDRTLALTPATVPLGSHFCGPIF